MNRPSAVLLTICLLVAGCRTLPYGSTPGSPHSASDYSFTSSTPDSFTQTSPGNANALTEIPLPVGYGFHNSWFDLYFTDPTNPAGKQITGGPDGPLAAAIDAARLSVDAAIYSLSLNSVRDALIHAYRRGVQVRIVMESDNMDSADPNTLMDAGLPILGDHQQGLMHDKFVVIDRSDVWTGSMNFTNDGAYADNNNMIHIRSEKVAEDYETDFDQMYVDGKFGPNAGTVTPNPRVIVGGTPLDIYFSPNDHVQAGLIDLLNNAQTSIYFLAYSFTADPLGEAIRGPCFCGCQSFRSNGSRTGGIGGRV